ncbi:glycosyltransferase [Clostridium chromiireducens]|uniref:Glycosyltransferase n=1 Tax=Clostridium chromiireducens TaxID=225345 RepID=A0A399IQW0_9CLOT|nr:glycosyltransferase [Clostridium chromiireducens]RII35433.1 glycosyltransferase [Clostridium chromiireducens]
MNLKVLRNKFLIIGTIVSSVIYLVWRIFFTIPFGYGIVAITCGIYLLLVEIVGMIEAAIHYYSMSNIEYPVKPNVDDILFPDVDVFIATYNEPVELLYKTVNGCINMDYPDKSKVHIFICDDSNRAEMKELADSMGINYITRTEHIDAKAGNLNNALAKTNSPLIVTFDADMIPMHDFLTTCVPYFLTEEKIGFVQTPQSFYNPDLFQYCLFSEGRIPNEQDYFYRDVQVSRNKTNSVIYGGSNTMILRKALEEIGGFYTKVITEDFATGLLIQSKGYKCYAINEIHASGLSPSDLKSLIKQRERWSRGCIQTGRKLNILFRKGLNIEQKLSYISAISYWYSCLKRLAYIMAPIMFSVFGVVVLKCNLIQVLIFWLPMYLFSDATLKKLSNNIRSTKWTNIYETILFPSLLPVVILETLGISQRKFAVTRKDGKAEDDRNYQIKKIIPHSFFAVLSVIGIINCIKMTFETGSPAYSVLLFWLIVNLYNIIMSIFFMLGRNAYRKSERVSVEIDCNISYGNKTINCKTIDISEGGIGIVLDEPIYIPYDRSLDIALSTERYVSKFKGQIVQVSEIRESWKYALKISEIDDSNLKKLLSLIYDREPTLPKYIEKNNSIFDDIRINILSRGKKSNLLNRKLPRIKLNKKLKSEECGEIIINDFNYEYAVIKTDLKFKNNKVITVKIEDEITIRFILDKQINYNESFKKKKQKIDTSLQLYKIQEYETIAEDEVFKSKLSSWQVECKHDLLRQKQESVEQIKLKYLDEFDEMLYI